MPNGNDKCVITGSTPSQDEKNHWNDIMRTSGIYQIVNIINQKKYIGSSNNTTRRWHEHKKHLRKNNHNNIHLQRAWNKYGENAFTFNVIEEVQDKSLLCDREQYWIDSTPYKYNIDPLAYSSRGRIVSEETKRKLSDSRMGKFTGEDNPFYGQHHSPLTIKNMKRKLRNIMSGTGNPFYGKHHTHKTKQLLSNIHTGRKQPSAFCENQRGNSRGAKRYNVIHPTGEISEIRNLANFCRHHGLYPCNAHLSISKNRPYKGYTFQPL